jgi:DNA polymerase-3 subunit delta'
VVDALGKLCHDALACASGGAPRFFPPAEVPADAALPALVAWQQDLARLARHDEHPWNEALLLDAVLARAARALRRAAGGGKGHAAAAGAAATGHPGGPRLDTLAS